jgi:hypothetical protein
MAEQQEQALSETLAVVLIGMLVIIATVLLIASLTGVMTKMLNQPALIVVKADDVSINGGIHAIRLSHLKGDAVNLNGTSQSEGVSIISFSLIEPVTNKVFPVTEDPLNKISKTAWRSGDTLYIYKSGSSYVFSDVAPIAGDLGEGTSWTIIIQDDKVHVLLHTLPVMIK